MENSAKILLLGKTGVGKSSFINYFLGKDLAKAGDGKPITQELTSYEVDDGRYPIEIFDSKGIEAKIANEQKNDIISEVKRRNNGYDVFNWFHTIFYCVTAEKKFEDFEAQFIRELQSEISQHVHIILTKCDRVEPETVEHMKDTIKDDLNNDDIEIFEVVSVNKKFRNGTEAKQRGKEALSEQVFRLLWEDIATKLSWDYAKSLRSSLISVADDTLRKAETLVNKIVRFKTIVEFTKDEDKVNDDVNKLIDGFKSDLNRTMLMADLQFNDILRPAAKLYASYKGVVTDTFAEDVELSFGDWEFEGLEKVLGIIDDDDKLMKKLFPNLAKLGIIQNGDFVDDDNASFWQILKQLAAGIGDLFTLKSRLHKFCKSVHKEFINSIPSDDVIRDEAYKRIIEYVEI